MKRILPVLTIISSLFIQACGGANQWEGLSGAASDVHTEVYVSQSTGNDITGDGSSEKPFASIARGMDDASTRGFSVVRVAQGNYVENINLIEGISLYGGYDPLSWTRNSALYVTEINGGTGSAITADIAGITTATVVDGFSLQSTGAPLGSVRILNASPTISNNTIGGSTYGIMGDGGSAVISGNTINAPTGIYSNMSSDTIRNNTINATLEGIRVVTAMCLINGNTINSGNTGINCALGGACTVQYNIVTASVTGVLSDQGFAIIRYNTITCTTGNPSCGIDGNLGAPEVYGNHITAGSGTSSFGIRNQGGDIMIYNNVITGGSGSTISFGIYTTGVCLPEIYNNTINGGVSSNISAGIDIDQSSPRISNNIIYISAGGPTQYGIWEENVSSDPLEFRNNNIFTCTTALYRDEGAANITTEGGLAAVGTGNLSRDLTGLIDAQGRRTAPWPIEVIGDGLNGAVQAPPWGFNIDRNRTPRTTSAVAPLSWSMGAYEYDAL